MAKKGTKRAPEWTSDSQQDTRAIDLPRPDDFDYEGIRLGYHGTADLGLWFAESWPMCTQGNPQRLRHPVSYSVEPWGFRQIELHVPVSRDERTCNVIALEDAESVRVRAFVCCRAHDWDSRTGPEYGLMPMDLHTHEKLRTRRVIDYDTGLELPLRPSLWPSRQHMAELRASWEEQPCDEQPIPADLDIPF